jgi:hypothetical protein
LKTDGLRLDEETQQKILEWINRTMEANKPTIPEVNTVYDTSTLRVNLEHHLDELSLKLSCVTYTNPYQQQILHRIIQKLVVRFIGHFIGRSM